MFSAADLCHILAHTHIHICTHTKHADPSRALVLSHPGPFRMEVLNIMTDSCQALTIFSKFPSRLIPSGPANSHTHTLSMHCCNTKLSCLVCFSRADFADHVKPRLRQWDPWRALDGRYGSDIYPCMCY